MTEKRHNFGRNEIMAGLLVIVSITTFLGFTLVVMDWRPGVKEELYYAYFEDTLGLNIGADVRFGGALVGKVSTVALASDDEIAAANRDDQPDQALAVAPVVDAKDEAVDLAAPDAVAEPDNEKLIKVAFLVREGVPINVESRAYVTAVSLTAEKHLAVSTGEWGADRLEPGATVQTRASGLFEQAEKMLSDLGPSMEKVGDALEKVNLLFGVEKYSTAKNPDPSKEELTTIADLFKEVEQTIESAESMVDGAQDDVDQILAGAMDVKDTAQAMLSDVRGIIDKNTPLIDEAILSMRNSIAVIESETDEMEGLAAKLDLALVEAGALGGDAREMIGANRPAIEDLILDLRETARYLKEFTRTLSEQPQAVLRGAKPTGRSSE